MKKILPILLLVTGCVLLFSQTQNSKPAFKIRTLASDTSERIVAEQKKILAQQEKLLKAKQAADTAAIASAQSELAAAQSSAAALVAQAAPAAPPTATVNAQERDQLLQEVTEFYNDKVVPASTSASRWEAGLTWLSLALGFFSSVCSAFNWNKAAGLLAASVVLASGAPNVLPINQKVIYFQTLSNQTDSLISALNLTPQLTSASYDDDVRKWQVLQSAINYPGGDSAASDLLTNLEATKIAVPAQ